MSTYQKREQALFKNLSCSNQYFKVKRSLQVAILIVPLLFLHSNHFSWENERLKNHSIALKIEMVEGESRMPPCDAPGYNLVSSLSYFWSVILLRQRKISPWNIKIGLQRDRTLTASLLNGSLIEKCHIRILRLKSTVRKRNVPLHSSFS